MSRDSHVCMPFLDSPTRNPSVDTIRGENSQQLTSAALRIYRWVCGFMLLGLLWKVRHFAWFIDVYQNTPLNDAFFPAWGRSAWVLVSLYMMAVIGGGVALVARQRRILKIQAAISAASLFLLNIHQGSYNDVTFLTAFWSSVWCLWFIHRCQYDPTTALQRKGAFLANAILAMILLGGAVGKWSSEYWNGSVLYEVYFVDRDFWGFKLLRQWFELEALKDIACWYSRFVVVVESSAALALWVLPRRSGSILAIVVFASIAIMSNFYLFSVLFSVIGLATVGLHRVRSNLQSTRSGKGNVEGPSLGLAGAANT